MYTCEGLNSFSLCWSVKLFMAERVAAPSQHLYIHTYDLKTVLRSYSTQTQSITFWTWLDFVANLAQLTPPCKHINMHSLAITCRG